MHFGTRNFCFVLRRSWVNLKGKRNSIYVIGFVEKHANMSQNFMLFLLTCHIHYSCKRNIFYRFERKLWHNAFENYNVCKSLLKQFSKNIDIFRFWIQCSHLVMSKFNLSIRRLVTLEWHKKKMLHQCSLLQNISRIHIEFLSFRLRRQLGCLWSAEVWDKFDIFICIMRNELIEKLFIPKTFGRKSHFRNIVVWK